MDDMYLSRGKRLDNGEWVEGYYVRIRAGLGGISAECKDVIFDEICSQNQFEIDYTTIGRCTELRDKNGKLIFADDVCESIDGRFLIIWDNKKCAFVMQFHNYPKEMFYMEEMWEDSKIIGNLHENPELLEVSE